MLTPAQTNSITDFLSYVYRFLEREVGEETGGGRETE